MGDNVSITGGQFHSASGILLQALKNADRETVKRLLRNENRDAAIAAFCRALAFNVPGEALGQETFADELFNPFFANEEVKSNYGYPQGYAVKPIEWQADLLARSFQDNLGIRLDARETLAYARDLPDINSFVPEVWAGREVRPWVNWHVVPRREKIAGTENEAVEKVLDLIGKTRTFYNYRKGNLGPKYLRLSERTAVALQMFGERQKGDFLLIPAQFGLTHRGRSVRRVRVVYAPNEFGLVSFIAGCMILSHPERLVQWEQLHIDCPGDEYSPGAGGVFSDAPIFGFGSGEVEFDARWVDSASERYGSASGFIPAFV